MFHIWNHYMRWFYLKLKLLFVVRLKLIIALTQWDIPLWWVEIFCTEVRFSYCACPHNWLLYIQRETVSDFDCSAKPFLLLLLEKCSWTAHTPCISKKHTVMCNTSSCNLHALLHNLLLFSCLECKFINLCLFELLILAWKLPSFSRYNQIIVYILYSSQMQNSF